MTHDADILIIGGGLAGLVSAIHLARQSLRVLLLEKHPYPQHKVCGEYLSNEILPYLDQLGLDLSVLQPARINQFLFSSLTGKTIESALPLGGLGISRYALDAFLCQKACQAGAQIVQDQVVAIHFENDSFRVDTASQKTYRARFAIGAYGKRSALDRQLHRSFMQQESPWVGVKMHYRAHFPANLVSLHNFEGGYCGLSQVENEVVNACYLAHFNRFKQYRNLAAFQEAVLQRNPLLRDFFAQATPLFDKPLTISQISFAPRKPVENHLLLCGDTAGVIHPLCGNGMAMAMHSAKLASELIVRFYQQPSLSRAGLEQAYTAAWHHFFNRRLTTGRIIQSLLQKPRLAATVLQTVPFIPAVLPVLIKQTHGNPIT